MRVIRALFLALISMAVVGVGAPAATASVPLVTAAVPLTDVAYNSYGYSTYISGALASSGIKSGFTGYSSVGCTTQEGVTHTNQLPSANLGVATVGAVTSTAKSAGSTSSRTASGATYVGAIRLLSGLISADAVWTSSTSTITSTGVASGTNASKLVNLVVGGVAISAATAPNTTLSLKLNGVVIGRVVINQQSKVLAGGYVITATDALDVTMTANALGLGAGARVIVGRSYAALAAVPVGFAGGTGYGLKATTIDGTVKAGPLSLANVPCSGGSAIGNVAGTAVPGVLSIGAMKTTASSVAAPTLTSSVTSSVAGVNVLSGLITANTVTASSGTSRAMKAGPVTALDRSTFLGLKVLGFPLIGDSVAPNTKLVLPGLGTVTLHKVTRTATSIRVVMVEVVLSKVLGALPTGTKIEIGVSESSVR
ncbi:choice-of-anchor P family protein [Calidifontibacter terrae]